MQAMLHPDPAARPSVAQLLRSKLLSQLLAATAEAK